MRNIVVKVHPSKSNLKKKDQLAWKIAEIASDKAKLNKDAIEKMKGDEINAKLMELRPDAISSMLRLDYSKVDKTAWIDGWNKTLTK